MKKRMDSPQVLIQGVIHCPACQEGLKVDSNWCPRCGFTGGDSVTMFSDSPPPLLPILDAAGILKARDFSKIEAARETLRRRFPQFHWRICTVTLPPETRLPVFGFWLLNMCPLDSAETRQDRASTVLLLINAASGQVSAIPGYAVESYLSDETWKLILREMTESWRRGSPGEAIVRFFTATLGQLEKAWASYGSKISTSGRR
jgi:hypothetical protein